jgi:hypothetical protein
VVVYVAGEHVRHCLNATVWVHGETGEHVLRGSGAKVFDLSDGSFSGARMPSVVVWGTGDARFDNFEAWRLP